MAEQWAALDFVSLRQCAPKAFNELWHLYYCPFCGKRVKARGFGK
jgi:hypothetical protein